MLRKDVRSLVMSMLLGDGCLSMSSRGYASITLCHGQKQKDYLVWKASLLSVMWDRDVKVRPCKKDTAYQSQITNNRFKSWHKFITTDGKKDITKVLKYINHPEMALAIWLMDDGYVEPSINKLASGEKKLYGARFRIFTCSTPITKQEDIILWFQDNLNVTPSIKFQKRGKKSYVSQGDDFPFLKFNSKDSLHLWSIVREFILQFESMRYKFRHIEEIYQRRLK